MLNVLFALRQTYIGQEIVIQKMTLRNSVNGGTIEREFYHLKSHPTSHEKYIRALVDYGYVLMSCQSATAICVDVCLDEDWYGYKYSAVLDDGRRVQIADELL